MLGWSSFVRKVRKLALWWTRLSQSCAWERVNRTMKTGWATEREKVGEIWNRVKKCSASSQEQCRGSLSRSRPASWGSWEACIPKFRVNLKSVEFIVFYPIRVCLNSHLLENNQFCPIFSDRILFLPLPSRSRPSPPISSTLLTSLASDYLIAVQMRAREQFFSFFSDPIGTPEHPHTTGSRPTRILSLSHPYLISIPHFVFSFQLSDLT